MLALADSCCSYVHFVADKVVRENAVEELIAFLSGKAATEQQEDKDEADEVEQDWDDVKLPKAFRKEQMRILWQGCFYCAWKYALEHVQY